MGTRTIPLPSYLYTTRGSSPPPFYPSLETMLPPPPPVAHSSSTRRRTISLLPPVDPPLSVYRHDPYNSLTPLKVLSGKEEVAAELTLPSGTLHKQLLGTVEFVPYPSFSAATPPPAPPGDKSTLKRIFIGQLPYRVTDEQVAWMCSLFCESDVYYPERITRAEERTGMRQLTGCLHVYCDSDSEFYLLKGLHKRMLVDNTGVWYARTAEQLVALTEYCRELRDTPARRPHKMPYTAVVVQKATSSFVPTNEWMSHLGRVA